MTEQSIYEMSEKYHVNLHFVKAEGFKLTVKLFGKKKNRKQFIDEFDNRKPMNLHVDFIEYRFSFPFRIAEWFSKALRIEMRKGVN